MYILGIETSCDETAFAIYSEQGLVAHVVHSQVDLHALYDGVVPELASRDHIKRALPLLKEVLQQANIDKKEITAIAYTQGPGLMGALLVGAVLAKSLAFSLNIPALGIHHLEAHLLAPMLEPQAPNYPFIALLVSGGHSLLAKVNDIGEYQILGESLDDAAGEAFDKTAKILGLPYPGGPVLAKLAENGDSKAFNFPRPMLDKPNLDFSFSGLKTAVLYAWKASDQSEETRINIAASFQQAIVETLLAKSYKALKKNNIKHLVVAGGVGANQLLRNSLQNLALEKNFQVYFPRLEFCTDNAAMVAYTGYLRFKLYNQQDKDLSVNTKARWSLEEII